MVFSRKSSYAESCTLDMNTTWILSLIKILQTVLALFEFVDRKELVSFKKRSFRANARDSVKKVRPEIISTLKISRFCLRLLLNNKRVGSPFFFLVLFSTCRVPCVKEGGIRFTMNGFDHFNLVLVTNVGGNGDVSQMYIKGSGTGWIRMKRNWGQNWQCDVVLVGQGLSFIVVLSHGHVIASYDVAPPNWQFGQTFEGNQVPL